MNLIKMFLFLPFICSVVWHLEQAVWAHPQSRPVRGQLLMEDNDVSHGNKGGYGYIASSEAEAYESFRFGCTNQELQSDFMCATTGQSLPQIGDRKNLFDTINAGLSAIVLQKLREQMAEKIILEHASLTNVPTGEKTRPSWPKILPSCLDHSSHSQKNNPLTTLHSSLPAGMTPLDQLSLMDAEKRKTHNKFNSMINSYSSGNLVRSIMLYDQLKVRRDYYCSSDPAICLDLNNQLNRIESSYPMLFGSKSNPVPKTHLDEIHNALYEIAGATSSGDQNARSVRGRALYRSHILIPNQGGGGYNEFIDFESAMAQKIEKAHDEVVKARNIPQDKLTPAQKNARDSLDHLNKSILQIQMAYREKLQGMLSAICSPVPGMQIADFINSQPNVVRQLMADASPQDRASLRLVLCAQNLRPAMAPKEQCQGISKISNKDGDKVHINRLSYSWPFSSQNEYTIKYPVNPKGALPTIQLTVNFPTTIRPIEKALEFVNSFKTNVQGFYNCTGGNTPPNEFGPATSGCLNATSGACLPEQIETIPRMSCPPSPGFPKINFEFNFVPRLLCINSGPPGCIKNAGEVNGQKMILHQCYNAEMNGSGQDAYDCNKIRDHVVNKCKVENKRLLSDHKTTSTNTSIAEFDEYLNNIITPFAVVANSSLGNLASNYCTVNGKIIDNSQTNTDYCKGLGNIVVNGKKLNCQIECLQAVRECRRPHQRCWSDTMISAYCDGSWDERTGRLHGTPKPAGHYSFNRQDSNNLTTNINTSTFIHEVGHILNLDDEYQDDAYPISPQGEDDSMMNYSGPNARFYPRHFDKMLIPARCVNAGPYATTGAGL